MAEKRESTIIKAGPEWFVAVPTTGEDTNDITGMFLEPIIAWRVDVCRERDLGDLLWVEVFPITLDGQPDENAFIKSPDGRFQILRGAAFASETDALRAWLNGDTK